MLIKLQEYAIEVPGLFPGTFLTEGKPKKTASRLAGRPLPF